MRKYYEVRRSVGTTRRWYICTYHYDPSKRWNEQDGVRWPRLYRVKREAEGVTAQWNRERELNEARRILDA